jgi:hypothetical protein
MSRFNERVTEFIAELRAAGVRISVAESIDAMRAVAAAGFERARMREALAATLIKDEADRPAFDELFGRFFASRDPGGARRDEPRAGGEYASGRGRSRRSDEPPKQREQEPERGQAPRESTRDERAVDESEQRKSAEGRDESARTAPGAQERDDDSRGAEAERHGRLRALGRLPFARYTELDYDDARDALRPLVRRFRARLGRRLRLAGRGRLDFRRTIRASLQRGGALADLRFRSRRPRHIDLLILADISGSVRHSTKLLLELLAGARQCFRSVRSFVYIDRLAEADFEERHLVMTPPLDLYARSDFGRVLRELWERHGEILTRTTVVVIMGDARNNRRPPRADIVREIARRVRAVVWLNPEERRRWGTGDSAIAQYEREVTAVLAATNLRELEAALAQVA